MIGYAQNIFVHQRVVNALEPLGIKPDASGRLSVEAIILAFADMMSQGQGQDVTEALAAITGASLMSGARTSGASADAVKITNRQFDYSVKRKGSRSSVTYDLAAFRNSLPKDFQLIDAQVLVTDVEGTKTSGTGVNGIVDAASIPVTAKFTAAVQGKHGIINFESQIHAREAISGKGSLAVVADNGGGAELTIAQHLEKVEGDAQNANQRVSNLEESGLIIAVSDNAALIQTAMRVASEQYADTDERLKNLEKDLKRVSDKVSSS